MRRETEFFLEEIASAIAHDSIGDWGDAANVGGGMTYCGNNPVNWVDPFGEKSHFRQLAEWSKKAGRMALRGKKLFPGGLHPNTVRIIIGGGAGFSGFGLGMSSAKACATGGVLVMVGVGIAASGYLGIRAYIEKSAANDSWEAQVELYKKQLELMRRRRKAKRKAAEHTKSDEKLDFLKKASAAINEVEARIKRMAGRGTSGSDKEPYCDYEDSDGRLHGTIPGNVPDHWNEDDIEDAIFDAEESLDLREGERENYRDRGEEIDENHQRRIELEREWLEELKSRLSELKKRK